MLFGLRATRCAGKRSQLQDLSEHRQSTTGKALLLANVRNARNAADALQTTSARNANKATNAAQEWSEFVSFGRCFSRVRCVSCFLFLRWWVRFSVRAVSGRCNRQTIAIRRNCYTAHWAQAIPPIATHFSVAWSVYRSTVALVHSTWTFRRIQIPFGVGSHTVLDGNSWDLGAEPAAKPQFHAVT